MPAKIIQVTDIPRTRSCKIAELSVRFIINGKKVKNLEALANPEWLTEYENIEELDYFEFRNNNDLSFNGRVSESRLFYAIYKGKVRLIDNLKV